MRVISQKGMPVMTDIPYEKATISQSMIEPNKIVAWDFFWWRRQHHLDGRIFRARES